MVVPWVLQPTQETLAVTSPELEGSITTTTVLFQPVTRLTMMLELQAAVAEGVLVGVAVMGLMLPLAVALELGVPEGLTEGSAPTETEDVGVPEVEAVADTLLVGVLEEVALVEGVGSS